MSKIVIQLVKSIIIVFKYAPAAAAIKVLERTILACLSPVALLCTQQLVDSIYEYINGEKIFPEIIFWMSILILIALLTASIELIKSINQINLQRSMNKKFTKSIIDKYLKIRYSCFEDSKIKDTLLRMEDNPQDKILEIFNHTINVIAHGVTLIGYLYIFSKVSILFAVVFVFIIMFMVFINFKAMVLVNDLFNSQTIDERKMNYLSNLLCDKHSLQELKIYGAKEFVLGKWVHLTKKVLNDRLAATIKSQKQFALSGLCLTVYIGVLIFSLIGALDMGKISIGLFVSLISSAASMLNVAQGLSSSFAILSKKYLQMEHYNIFINLPEIEENTSNVFSIDNFEIEFSNVSFTYPNTKKEILHNISFSINKNEKLAIVGRNGAGKSTIIKLLCRLYKPSKGNIYVNKYDLYSLSQSDFNKFFSVVFQDYVNYSLSIRENVAFGSISKIKNDEAIWEALNYSMANEFVTCLDTSLGKIEEEGIDLSGGQWQRLAIARAFLSQSTMIILDEPTAALDPVAESEMYSLFYNTLKDKSYIMISHRLASARMADKIFVIDDGKLIEKGSHSELYSSGGIYTKMWNEQSKWYREGS